MIDQAGPIRAGEELDLSSLAEFLCGHIPAATEPWKIEQFPSGYSNLTYLLRCGDQEFVLRRPPFGNAVQSAHDMGREYRVLAKLCEVYAPAPRPLVYCSDKTVIGDEFYVMERRSGIVLRAENTPNELHTDPLKVTQLCQAFIDNLAGLHLLNYQAAGLGDLGKPQGYVERQINGWMKRYESARTDDHHQLDRLGAWLVDHRPPDSRAALIHNDYKYDNLILDPTDMSRIVAVLDWEMATVGDPWMDLGMALAYWVQADDSESQRVAAFGPTMLPGSLSRRQLLGRYAERTGQQTPNILFYYGFGLYKLAVIVQQIYARFVRGSTHDPRFARLSERVASLGETGMHAIVHGEL